MHLFYAPDISADVYPFSEEESRHAVKVLRLRAGERVRLTDGCGGWYLAEVMPGATPKACVVRVVERQQQYGKRSYGLHIALAPTKNIDRYEWFLEKATEIGIDRITPLLCEHSERKTVKYERSEKVILSAVKQSLKAYVPRLDELTSFREFIGQTASAGRFIAHCDEATPVAERRELFPLMRAGAPDYCILIGPEGDFSPAEVEMAVAAGWIPVSLGESRLRTETAGVAVATMAALAGQQAL